MNYEKSLIIPRNTPITAKVTETMDVHPGIVRQVSIFFPPGCCGLARMYVKLWERQVWPSNIGSYFHGDGQNLVFPEDLRLVDPPFEFVLVGWNLDDTFQHTVTLRLAISPEETTTTQLLSRLLVGATGAVTEYEE